MQYEHLIGRQFDFGTHDCIDLVRCFYRDNFGIEIENIARPSGWDADKIDIIRLSYESQGFEMLPHWRVKNLRPGDLLAMAIRSGNPNHLAVYLGENEILHHRTGRMSEVEVLRDTYCHLTSFVLRHPAVPDYSVQQPDVKIEDLLRARYQLKADEVLQD